MKKIKIFSHDFGPSMGHDDSVYEGISYVAFGYYGSRAFLSAEPGDIAILPADEKSAACIDVLSILNPLGIGPDPRDVMFISFDRRGKIVDPENALRYLRKRKKSGNIAEGVDLFSGRALLPHLISRESGTRVLNSVGPEIVKLVDCKAFFQGIAHPAVSEGRVIRNQEEASSFFASRNGSRFLAKTSRSASGLSAVLIEKERGRRRVMEFIEEGKTVVVQRYYRHRSSPSVNVEILPDASVQPLFTSSQILSFSEDGTRIHEGNVVPAFDISQETRRYILIASVEIADMIAAVGYRGPLGVDWVVGPDGIKAVEVNARVTAPRYPYDLALKLGAKAFCFKNIRFRPGTSAENLRQWLNGIFWNGERGWGVLPYNFNPIDGKTSLVAYAPYPEMAIELVAEAERICAATIEVR